MNRAELEERKENAVFLSKCEKYGYDPENPISNYVLRTGRRATARGVVDHSQRVIGPTLIMVKRQRTHARY